MRCYGFTKITAYVFVWLCLFFFSMVGCYYETLTIVPCAVQYDLVYLFIFVFVLRSKAFYFKKKTTY